MRPRLLVPLTAALFLASAAAAGAHSLTVDRPWGDIETTFHFHGTRWQPGQRVLGDYFRRERDARPVRTFPGRVGRDGKFSFHLVPDFGLVDTGLTEKMCFRQFDTRFGRTFRACRSFYVQPPQARFEPPSGAPGDAFVLVATGFLARRALVAELTVPGGEVQTYSLSTRGRGAFITGPFGPLYLQAGWAARGFQSSATDPLGIYTVVVRYASGPERAGARAGLLLR